MRSTIRNRFTDDIVINDYLRDIFNVSFIWEPSNSPPKFLDSLLVSQVIYIPALDDGASLRWEYELPDTWDQDGDLVVISQVEVDPSGAGFISFDGGLRTIFINGPSYLSF